MARYTYKRDYGWDHELAYIVGLMASDGCLSKDGRHISFTSKDEQLAVLFRDLINPKHTLARKGAGAGASKLYYLVQFSDSGLYDFLLNIGMTPNKSLTIPALKIPDEYFADFLRGEFDGDGCIYGYQDMRWRSSFMFYSTFYSASLTFLEWLQDTISKNIIGIGRGTLRKSSRAYALSYAKKDSTSLFKYMYYRDNLPCLQRKHNRYLELFDSNQYAV